MTLKVTGTLKVTRNLKVTGKNPKFTGKSKVTGKTRVAGSTKATGKTESTKLTKATGKTKPAFREIPSRVVSRQPAADDRAFLEQMLEEAYHLPNWNATHLRGALRRVTPAMAAWRPPHAKRSIADLVVHCAYWKYALRRKLAGDERGGFPFKGSNWFATAQPLTAEVWAEYLRLLDRQHEQLREAIRATQVPLDFRNPHRDGQWSSVQRTFWLAIHDGYHTGQVNLLKAMYRRAFP